MKVIFTIILIVFIVGCDEFEHLGEADVVYSIDNVSIEPSDTNILVNRLSDYPASLFSEVKFLQSKNELVFTKGAPKDELITYLSTKKGVLVIGGQNRYDSWIFNKHLSRVNVMRIDEEVFLDIMLTDEGAQVMSQRTKNKLGKVMVVRIDDEIIVSAEITQVLEKSIRVSTDGRSVEDVMRLSTLLKHGRLSQSIKLRKKMNPLK